MDRRSFLQHSTLGLAASLPSAQLLAASHELPEIKWRLASSYPKSLDTLYGASEVLAQRIKQITGGKFEIRVFAAGELVPGLQVLDACQSGAVECGHSCSCFYVGKNKTFAFDAGLPFGLDARQQNAWLYHGGGLEQLREFFRGYNVLNFPGGNTGVQMGGWFRQEIQTLADLQGLKMRISGLGGEVMRRLGVVPQQISGGDIYPALEKGALDAAEWSGPYDDEKLGFVKIAPHYYFPGWWESGSQISFLVNIDHWAKLPTEYQSAFQVAAAEANLLMLAKYDTQNPPALARLVPAGAHPHAFSKDILQAAFKIATELYEEEAQKNASFQAFYNHWKQFRSDQYQWLRIAESGFNNFMYSQKL